MNYELREKVTAANEIVIGYLQPEYERIDSLREQITLTQIKTTKNKKLLTRLMIVLWVVSALMLAPHYGEEAMYFPAVLLIPRFILGMMMTGNMKKKIGELNGQINETNQHIAELEDTYAAELSILPAEYHFETASRYIVKMVTDDRAETIGQALSQCDDFLHRLKLEQNSDAALREQKMQTEHMRNVERNTFISAMANVATARNTRR